MSKHCIILKEPDKAYVSNMLWLPKAFVPQSSVAGALEYWDVDDIAGTAVRKQMWSDSKHHTICPREFISSDKYPFYPFPFIDLSQKNYKKTNLVCTATVKDEAQAKAWDALSRARGGILHLGCGKGKTVLALMKAAQLGCPTLFVVHNSFLMEQWLERIAQHTNARDIGVIQGGRFEWDKPIVVAMIQTLAMRVKEGKLPPEFFGHFGAVFYDEVHHLSAPLFVTTAPLIAGHRFGLTATPTRVDGTEYVYNYHIGSIFYSDITQDLIPQVYVQLTPVKIKLDQPKVRDKRGELNLSKIRTFLGDDKVSNDFRAMCIKEALDTGRKIIAISHSKNMLENLHKMFPGSGLIVQETPAKKRPEILKNSNLCFAIRALGAEGMDDVELDALFLLTPYSSPNDLQQMLGRIQRKGQSKRHPIVVLFDDVNVKPLHGLCMVLKEHLKKMGIGYLTLQSPVI